MNPSYYQFPAKNDRRLPPNPYGGLLGYQSVNVIDPTETQFQRTFAINQYYLTITGQKRDELNFDVQYTKKYVDGRTTWFTEPLNLLQINDLLSKLEELDRQTERYLSEHPSK